MMSAHTELHKQPGDQVLAGIQLEAVKEYHYKHKAYREFLAQKAKHAWIKDGDKNTTIFHQSIKARRLHNQVHSIYDAEGVWQEGS